jgi:putative sigma-54 modulation protein
MLKDKIKISFVGMESSDSLKEYITEKIEKKKKLLKEATLIEVFFKENIHSRGVKEDFRVDITITLPNSPIRVEQSGEDMYANIDLAMDTLDRRLKRYRDRKGNWEGVKPWKVLEAEAALQALTEEVEGELTDYSDYVPKMAVRKKVKDIGPMVEAEAIERMELLGYDQFLFLNKSTGKMSMIYRRRRGGYGLVEPEKA